MVIIMINLLIFIKTGYLKKTNLLTLNLIPTQDILAYMGSHKKNQYLIGFALETNNAYRKC